MADHSSSLISEVFSAWKQRDIPFLVLRNYEGLPRQVSNDIDVLVAAGDLKRAEQTLVQAALAAGFRRHNRAEFATLALYFFHPQSGAQIHFDLFPALKWRGFEFLSSADLLARKIPRDTFFVPHPAHEACANLLSSLLFKGKVKEKYRKTIASAFRDAPADARALLAKNYGESLADWLVQSGAQENWNGLETKLSEIRRALIRRQIRQRPWKTFWSLDADCDRLLKRMFFPPGIVVVLCGPDGCGKSTVAPLIIQNLSRTFSPEKGRQIHWKPRIFSQTRETGAPETNPHGEPARNVFASLLYLFFHWTEFFLGWRLQLFPAIFRGGMVLVDRYYFDFFVDQKRYRLRVPQFFVRIGYALLPKPDLVFLLDAPAEVLRQRKQEVPPEETARQRKAYLDLVRKMSNGRIIDAAQPVENVTEAIQKNILDYLAARTAKRHG